MKITSREAYVLGWVFGRLSATDPSKNIGGPPEWAMMRPFGGLAKAIYAAHQFRLVTPELDDQIAEALDEISQCPDEPEVVQPLENQSSWDLGYYAGKSGRPLSETFSIADARKKKGVTQKQLADMIGVDQALISRWESGKISPNKEHLQRIKEALN